MTTLELITYSLLTCNVIGLVIFILTIPKSRRMARRLSRKRISMEGSIEHIEQQLQELYEINSSLLTAMKTEGLSPVKPEHNEMADLIWENADRQAKNNLIYKQLDKLENVLASLNELKTE